MLYQTIQQFPKQLLDAWQVVQNLNLKSLQKRHFRRIIYAGMGGSSFVVELINDLLSGEIYLEAVRDYQLPPGLNSDDLVLCVSYSGNTEETLSLFAETLDRKLSLVAMGHGGQLEHQAAAQRIPFIKIPDCLQPRCAMGYFFASTLALLHQLDLIASKQFQLKKLRDFLQVHQNDFKTEGKKLSNQLKKRIPIIYGSNQMHGVCRIFKIKFNENAKVPSFYNVLPELNHNEMLGLTNKNFYPVLIFLCEKFMDPRIDKRIKTMKEIFKNQLPIIELSLLGKNLWEQSFAGLAIADYASYYLAHQLGVDPEPIALIEEFKKKLMK